MATLFWAIVALMGFLTATLVVFLLVLHYDCMEDVWH